MNWLILLTLYHTISGTFAWPQFWQNDQDEPSMNHDFDDLVSSLFNDFQFDISLPSPSTRGASFLNDYAPIHDGNYLADRALPTRFLFGSRFPIPFGAKESHPLYLTMESPDTGASSTYSLTKMNRVNGDTWRYTVQTSKRDDDMDDYVRFSTQKLYICHSAACSNDKGIEMNNILNGNQYRNYMHLVPTSAPDIEMETDEYEPQEWVTPFVNKALDFVNQLLDDSIHDANNDDGALDKASDWWHNTGNVMEKEYQTQREDPDMMDEAMDRNETESEYNEWENEYDDAGHVVLDEPNEFVYGHDSVDIPFVANNNRELMDHHDTMSSHGQKNLVLIEMTVIIIFIMVCGVIYAIWRFMVDRREKKRELNYYNISNM